MRVYNFGRDPKNDPHMIHTEDAPPGYHPVTKDSVRASGGLSPNRNQNICTQCDWRKDCCGEYSCMSYKRVDGVSVVFKRT